MELPRVAYLTPIFYHTVASFTSFSRKVRPLMLDFLRKRKRNWAILFLLVLIIIVFVAFYGGNQMGERAASEVAMINGEPISQREFAV